MERRSRLGPCLTGIMTLMMGLLSGCSGADGDDLDRAAWIERGGRELDPFKKKLMGALMQGLADGPEAAIEVCQVVAPGIAGELSTAGVELGRTSHKLRNEHNAPRPWIQPLLDEYAATPGKIEPDVVRLADGRVGYVEPILVMGMCLTCHGRDLSPGIAARIDEHYPRDQARGFEEGDFRGLFWVEFEAR